MDRYLRRFLRNSPLVVALFFPKYKNAKAAIAGAVVGEGVYFYLYLISGIEKSVMAAGAWGVIASFITMFAVAAVLNKNAPAVEK